MMPSIIALTRLPLWAMTMRHCHIATSVTTSPAISSGRKASMTRGVSVLCDVGVPRLRRPGGGDGRRTAVVAVGSRSRIALFYGRHHDRDAGAPDREPELRRRGNATDFRNYVPDPGPHRRSNPRRAGDS